MRRLVITVAAAVAIATSGAAIAYASIPDSSGVIHGCYTTKTRSLRVIDPTMGQTCTTGQHALNWRQAGGDGMIQVRVDVNVPFGESQGSVATGRPVCPNGYVAVGGGYGPTYSGPGYDQEQWTPIMDFGPSPGAAQEWIVTEELRGTPYTGGGSWTLSVFVNCLPTSA